jgi:hypothetical protein
MEIDVWKLLDGARIDSPNGGGTAVTFAYEALRDAVGKALIEACADARNRERAGIVAELRFIESSDKSGDIPTVRAMVAKRFADDIEAGRPLRGTE